MRRYFIRFLAFILICYLFDLSLFYLLNRPSRHFDWRYGKVREQKINADILIIGSSRGARGINAEILEKESGLSSFNFCYPGSSLPFHLYCFETYLKEQKHKPKIVLLAVDDDNAFKDNPWLSFRTNVLYGHTKYQDVNNLLMAFGENHWLSKYFNIAKLRPIHLGIGNQQGAVTDYISPLGSMPLRIKNENFIFATLDTSSTNYDSINEMPGYLEAFKNIQQLYITNKIQLLVCIPPNYLRPSLSFLNRVKELSFEETPVLSQNTSTSAYRDSSYYYDSSHLNYRGSIVYSKELVKYILHYK